MFHAIKTDYLAENGACGGAVGWGTALRHKVAGLISDSVSGKIFHRHNSSGCSIALTSTQSLTQKSTRGNG